MKFCIESLKRQRQVARLEGGEGVILDVYMPSLPVRIGQTLELAVRTTPPTSGWTYVAQGEKLHDVTPTAYSCGGLLAQSPDLPEVAGPAFICVR